jgi:ubiquinone/menaquinone biosynthesis C-methylase UbiE
MSAGTSQLFDDWPERYDAWFTTPAGKAVLDSELELVCELLQPCRNELILDAGCGTGIFAAAFLARGAAITGLDVSLPMLARARRKLGNSSFTAVAGDMLRLPFADAVFDKAVSVTALEFIGEAKAAVEDLFRVVKPGGRIVVATLNSLSPWAVRRKAAAEEDENSVFREARFYSPDEMRELTAVPGIIRTAVHFRKDDDPGIVRVREEQGRREGRDTGAFIAACWDKPAEVT